MDRYRRNELLLEYENVIHWVMKINSPLIAALRLEYDDVFQDLSIAAIRAIDRYDPLKSESLLTHLISRLQYEILNIRIRHKCHGMTGAEPRRMEIRFLEINDSCTGSVSDEFALVELREILSMLSADQRRVVSEKIAGRHHRKECEQILLEAAQQLIRNCYLSGNGLCG